MSTNTYTCWGYRKSARESPRRGLAGDETPFLLWWMVRRGCGSFFAHRREVVAYRKKTRGERRAHESQEEQTGAESRDASPVSAGLRDVLGMTHWRKEQQISDVGSD